ncbi:MAG: hypothetical protein AAGC74_10585 [Verrucomicrobiota bacterium]
MNQIALIARKVFSTAEKINVDHMAVGAIPAGVYGIMRATQDIDLLVSVRQDDAAQKLIDSLQSFVDFETQARFDTLT